MSINDDRLQADLKASQTDLRGSGRTIRLAFQYIDQMLTMPDTPVDIKDHYPDRNAHDMLVRKVILILDAAGVPFNRLGNTILEIPALKRV